MVSINVFREMALALPEAVELPHFHLASFRIKNKIFATLHADDKKAMLKLSLIDQSVYTSIDKKIIYPVPGGWGKQGATFIELSKVKKAILKEALEVAWKNIARLTLVKKYMTDKI